MLSRVTELEIRGVEAHSQVDEELYARDTDGRTRRRRRNFSSTLRASKGQEGGNNLYEGPGVAPSRTAPMASDMIADPERSNKTSKKQCF